MSVFLGVIAIVICVIISIMLSQKYVIRRQYFEDFYFFNSRLKTEVAFSQRTILSLIEETDKERSLFLDVMKEHFCDSEKQIELKHLKKSEVDYLDSYLNTIGKSDKATQLKFLEKIELEIGGELKKAKEEEIKYKSLYVKLGFLIGIAILIILL